MSDFYVSRILAYQDSGLSYRAVAVQVSRDSMSVCAMWNRWIQERQTVFLLTGVCFMCACIKSSDYYTFKTNKYRTTKFYV